MAKAVTSSECVFSDDLLLVDYLSALISSAPPTQHEFLTEYVSTPKTQIAQINLPLDPGSSRLKLVKNPKDTEIERLSNEVQTFRSENEHLKFRTELAEIDAEVLRAENEKLMAEVEQFKTRQINMRTTLGALQAEKKDLKLQIESLRNEIRVLAETKVLELSSQEDVAPANGVVELLPEADKELVKFVVSDQQDSVADQLENVEEPICHCPPQQKIAEITQVSFLERQIFSGISSSIVPAPTGVMGGDRTVKVDVQAKTPLDSLRNYPIPRTAPKNPKIISKIMKQQNASEKQAHYKQNEVLSSQEQIRVQSNGPVTSDSVVVQRSTQALQEVVAESQLEEMLDSQAINQDTRKALDTDEIDMGPAPVSKVTSKRNASRYEVMQKEAEDDTHTPGHKITFVT